MVLLDIFILNFFEINLQTGKSRGYAFIYYKHLKSAIDAKESCSGMEIDGRRIRVDYSITSRPHEPTPGEYKGRSTKRESHHHHRSRRYSPSISTRRRSRSD